MYLLRRAKPQDLNSLHKLSQLVTFINLPSHKGKLAKSIEASEKSFLRPSSNLHDNYYMFVLEDTDHKNIVGTSMIHAQHGTLDEPHFFLRVSQENKFSQSTQTGFIHGTLTLGHETNGYTEIGGLIMDPAHRHSPFKLGKQISFVRFLYMALFPDRFREVVHSELMPPFDKNGNSPLWEAIGRRFLNMDYHEADLLSRDNKEFILSLFPKSPIYETLLPLEARHAIGEVGPQTVPVRKMLKSIGFQYTHEVDPFDGGPHYRAPLKELKPVKNLFSAKVDKTKQDPNAQDCRVLMTLPHPKNEFQATMIDAKIAKNHNGFVIIPESKHHKDLQPYGDFETRAVPI